MSAGWNNIDPDDGTLHVVPVDDTMPHWAQACECDPRSEPHGDAVLIVHNAQDGRE